MRIKILTFLAVMALGAIFLLPPAHANLILNGSFEDGVADIGGFITVTPADGFTKIYNWQVTSGSVDYIGTYWKASDGVRSIDMTGTPGDGTIASTSFLTTAGATYKVTFDMSGNFDGGVGTNRDLEVSAGTNTAIYTYIKSATWSMPNSMEWSPREFFFTAGDGTSSVLQFKALGDGQYRGPVIDNVQASLVPLPGAMLLLGAGLVRLVTYGRRKKTLI